VIVGHLQSALKTRKGFFEKKSKTNAFRLFCGVKEGVAGLVVDLYADVIVIQVHEGKSSLDLQKVFDVARWYGETLKIKSVYLKTFTKARGSKATPESMFESQPLWGEPAPEELMILENGLRFVIRPYDGFATGLFLDQRNNRQFFRDGSSGKNILNCFSYTCGFSVACAVAGAKVTSVDVSKRYLNWGKQNFEVNGLPIGPHYFISDDIFEYLRLASKKRILFHTILLDPPSFSRNKAGGVFSVEKDFERLVEESLKVLIPEGDLFFSCNFSEWTSRDLKTKIQSLMKQNNRKMSLLPLPELPVDFQKDVSPISQVRILV
jgi:23S rRNA (cytosine1962-C5)-methyltransferase